MITVANCIGGPVGLAEQIKGSFEASFNTLEAVPGVRGFRLRRLGGARNNRCLFVSFTMWDGLTDFENWRRSTAFGAAHADRTRRAGALAQVHEVRMDFATTSEPSAADLDARVLARLSETQPDLVADGAQFVEEVTWGRNLRPVDSASTAR